MNTSGKICPNCNQDIGFWVLFKSPWPGKINCKHCATLIRYETLGWPMIIVFSLIYFAILMVTLSGEHLLAQSHLAFHALFALLLWCPFELAMAVILRNYHVLILKNN